MKKRANGWIAALCAVVLVAASAAASSLITARNLKTPGLQELDLKVVASGREAALKDENGQEAKPLLVGDTLYLPAGAVGDALGKSVEWDKEQNTLYLGKAPMEEDAQQLIDTLERTHPAFALEAAPEGYQAAKEALLAQAKAPECTLADFTWSAMAYVASMQDEHTRVDPFGGTAQPTLDIRWVADGERLLLLDGEGRVTDTRVTAVGGLPTAELFAVIDRYVASENQAGRDLNHAQWAASPALLLKAGALFSEENGLDTTVTLQDSSGQASTRTVGLAAAEAAGEEPVIATRQIGDVFYADFNQCVDGDQMQAAVSALQKAVEGGTGKVILDVRGNGGGNSDTCVQLLNAMGMQVPDYGVYIRYSPLAQGTYPDSYDSDQGGDRYEPHPETAKPNPAVRLVVLTDEETFSSATMLAVFVRDGKLGTVIGRPSSNAPNSYGDILQFRLNNSGLRGTVSHKQWLRPDQSAQGDELTPDLVTPVGEDALTAALEFLAD